MHAGQAFDVTRGLRRGKRHAIHICDAIAVADEIDRFVVERPLRVQLGTDVCDVHATNRVGVEVEERQLRPPKGHRVDVARIPFARKRQRVSVVRPRGLKIGGRIVGELAKCVRREVEHVEIGESARQCREGDRFSIRRPRRREDLPQCVEHQLAVTSTVARRDQHQRGVSLTDGRECEPVAFRTPRAI